MRRPALRIRRRVLRGSRAIKLRKARLGRGEVTVCEVAASLGRSRRQVQRMRKRLPATGRQGWFMATRVEVLKHRTSQEVREQVLMLAPR
jgi:hypothetical protein